MATLLGGAAVAVDLGKMYVAKSTAQRIADQSAMAAAFAYSQGRDTGSTAQNAASSLATANGAGGATVTASIVSSPTGDGNSAAMVVVSAPVSLSPLSSSIQPGTAVATVSATAYAEIQDVSACFIALNNTGITATGGTKLTANGCSVASNGGIAITQGPTFVAQAFDAVGTITAGQGSSFTTQPTAGSLFPGSSVAGDPYATGNIFSRIPTVAGLTAPSFPSVGSAPSGGTNQTCSSGVLSLGAGSYGTVTISGSCSLVIFNGTAGSTTNVGYIATNSWSGTIIFASGTYNINGFYFNGGSVTIDDQDSTAVFNIWSGYNTQSGTSSNVTFNGPGNFNIQGGINNYGSGTISFLNTYSSAPSSFTVAGGINMTHGNGSFPNGTYNITSGGIWNDYTSVTFGNGSFKIAGGIQFGAGGGSMTFGSALNANSVFQVPTATNGSALQTTGSSSLTIGSFTNVDLNGNVTIAGNVTLGGGTYTINGEFQANATGGGSISADSVSIVVAGSISFGEGFSSIELTAPSTITTATLGTSPTIALASQSSNASTVTSGATNTVIVGAVYMPNAALTLAGAGTMTGNGGCTVVDVGSASFTGGSSITTSCSGVSSITTAATKLVR